MTTSTSERPRLRTEHPKRPGRARPCDRADWRRRVQELANAVGVPTPDSDEEAERDAEYPQPVA